MVAVFMLLLSQMVLWQFVLMMLNPLSSVHSICGVSKVNVRSSHQVHPISL